MIEGFIQNITERKRSEAERATLTRDLQLLLESTFEGIYVLDIDGQCTMINESACRVLGYRPEEVIGRKVHDLCHPHQEQRCGIREEFSFR
ncbi:MAG TPA: PAS domain-containing protein, partial [Thermoanaerobaculia bacterium]